MTSARRVADQAHRLGQRVLPIYRQIYGQRHPRMADASVNLGALKYNLGYYPEVVKLDLRLLHFVVAVCLRGEHYPKLAN